MIGNYLSKIIPALQSRCTRFRFGPLKEEQILPRLEHVAKEEVREPIIKTTCLSDTVYQGVNLTEDGKKALMTLSLGDMRRVLNILQSCAMAFDTVSEVDKWYESWTNFKLFPFSVQCVQMYWASSEGRYRKHRQLGAERGLQHSLQQHPETEDFRR